MKTKKISGEKLKRWLFKKNQKKLACNTIDASQTYRVIFAKLSLSFQKRDEFMENVKYSGFSWSGIHKRIQFYYRPLGKVDIHSEYNQEVNRKLYQEATSNDKIPDQYQIKIDHDLYFKRLKEENQKHNGNKWEIYWKEKKSSNIIVKCPAWWKNKKQNKSDKDDWEYYGVEYRVYFIDPEIDAIECIYVHKGRISKGKVLELSKFKI